VISGVKVVLFIELGSGSIPLTEKIDNVFDDLSDDLFFSFKLAFEFLLKSFVLSGEELVLLVQTDANLLELVLV
jgi:hypothetical protein